MYASIHIDVDSIQTQLELYGYNRPYTNTVYDKAIPRIISFLNNLKIKATFFVVGKHLINENKSVIKELAENNHEIANHSMTHPFAFSKLSAKEKEKEIVECEKRIKLFTGIRPAGFRAPAWDIDKQTINILEKRNYLYDSSIFPSSLSCLMNLSVKFMSGKVLRHVGMGSNVYFLAPNLPYNPSKNYIWRKGGMRITELPVTAMPIFRLPFYGTFHQTTGKGLFNLTYKMLRLNKTPIVYNIQAMDFLDSKEDDIPLELKKHPGYKMSYKKKQNLYSYIFKKISKNYKAVTAREMVQKCCP